MDILDGSGLWSITGGGGAPPIPPPPIPVVTTAGGGAGGRSRLIHTIDDRSYYEALKFWLKQGRREPMNEAERDLLERARRMAEEEEEFIILL